VTTEGGNPPRRVRVTSPRTAAGRPHRVNVTSEIDAQTRLGEIYMSSLMRVQLRLAGLVVVAVLVSVGALPLSYWLFPSLDEVRVLGMPLAWVILGFGVYPLLVLLGWFYVRASERNENDFADMVERP
jgi:putative solute:sodium symporter small subunit